MWGLRTQGGVTAEGAGDPRPPAPPQIPQWVVDRAQAARVAAALCRRWGRRSVGITATAGLHGAGGFGKTTLAEMVWANRKVQRRFKGRIYRITLGLDVRSRAAIAAKVGEATRFIAGDTHVFDDLDLASAHLGRLLDARPEMLLILDDVWTPDQLAPFLVGGARCRRLITTRLPELLPAGAHQVRVDEMSVAQARQVLTFDISGALPEEIERGLLKATGRWPLLLRLANRLIHRQVSTGVSPTEAGAAVLEQLRRRGPAGLDPAASVDLNDPRVRQTAVRATVEAGTTLLPPGGYDRFTELGVFTEDETIPVALVIALWGTTAGLSVVQTRELCAVLSGLSLIDLDPAGGGRVHLHDVIRDFLRSGLGDQRLQGLHCALVDAAGADVSPAQPQPGGGTGPARAWWTMPDGYLADNLVTHLLAADRTPEAEALALDLRWIAWRLDRRAATAPIADLAQIPTPAAQQAARDLARTAHLLTPTTPAHAQAAVLRSRLSGYRAWHAQATVWRSLHPALYNRWPLPDLPDPAQRRTLTVAAVTVAISPDGTWLATTSKDGTVRMWDTATGRMTRTLTGHTRAVGAVAISPDGTWLATAGEDRKVRVWDAVTGRTTRTLTRQTGPTVAVAISPDGTWLAVIEYGTVRIRDVATGRTTRTLTSHGSWVHQVAVSPDGTWLATAGDNGTVRIWDTATSRMTRTLTGHTGPVRAVAISPDGTWLAATGHDGTVQMWDTATGRMTRTLTGHTGPVNAVAISPDGAWLATAGDDETARLWDLVADRATRTLTGHTGPVNAVTISPDGTWLATAGRDETVRVWEAGWNTNPQRSVSRGGIGAVAISPDAAWLTTAGDDGTVRIWDTATSRITRTLTGHTGPVHAVAISPDGTWLATAGRDETVRIWDTATGRATRTLTGHTGPVNAVTISPDGTWLATAGADWVVGIWDVATGRDTPILNGHPGGAYAVAASPDAAWLATTGHDGTVRIWDAATGRAIRTLTGHTGRVNAVAISPDGTWLATAGRDETVRIWDTATGRATRTLTGRVNAVAISPDGTWLATISGDSTVRIWESGTENLMAMMRADSALRACNWLPDGRGLAVAGDQGLYVYDFLPDSS
ncbi:NB-ARC domain-containing protein [Streptomyces sp. CA-106131]|uniref:NB-ARC domain-containing protein n=1 Tax=Streptomyces sp. CA-106131 TaxID=3240045 RepID=UPI003D92B2CF